MTTITTQGPANASHVNYLVMLVAALGIVSMFVATQPFNAGGSPRGVDLDTSSRATAIYLKPLPEDWCCLGSKPAEWPGETMTDVGDVASSVDNTPRMNPLIVYSVGLDPGAIDRLIGGTSEPTHMEVGLLERMTRHDDE